MKNNNPLRGTKDILFEDIDKFNYLKEKMSLIAKNYGFSEIKTPIMEEASVFQKNLGEVTDIVNKEIYTFLDKNDELIALKPEGTAPVVRAFLNNSLAQNLPAKLFYFEPMFRYERPQKGRQRQFYQFGVEYFGGNSLLADSEAILMASDILASLKIEGSTCLLNSLGNIETREKYKLELVKYLEKYFDDLSSYSKERLHKNPLRILDSKEESDKKVLENAPLIKDFFSKEEEENFNNLQNLLTLNNISYKVDNFLVRGIDYYTSTIFEFVNFNLGSQNALIAGGRYDNLVEQMGGTQVNAVGFAAGIERLAMLINVEEKAETKVAVLAIEEEFLDKSVIAATKVREQNIITEIFIGNLTKQLKKISAKNFDFVIIIGADEIINNKYKLKDLKNYSQEDLSLEEIIVRIKK